MIRVAIIDDDPKSRKELVRLLQKEPDISVVSEAETGLVGIKQIEERKPDVIFLDNKQPFTEGLEATELIVSKFENTRVIVLSMDSKSSILPLHSKHTIEGSLCQVGACFHLCQNCSSEDILAAIREGHQPRKGEAAVLRIEKQSRLNTDEILAKASGYFIKSGEGLEETERGPCCISSSGAGG